jgi:hypothetical protein
MPGPRLRSLGFGWTGVGLPTRGSITTAFAGTNNDLKLTSVHRGTKGNDARVAFVVAGTNTPLSVARSGNDVTVNVATNGAGAATSTGAQVRDAINASDEAKHLVRAENATGNDGTGVVAAAAMTALTGGTAPVLGRGSGAFTRVRRGGTSANG